MISSWWQDQFKRLKVGRDCLKDVVPFVATDHFVT